MICDASVVLVIMSAHSLADPRWRTPLEARVQRVGKPVIPIKLRACDPPAFLEELQALPREGSIESLNDPERSDAWVEIAAAVTDDLTGKVSAVDLVRAGVEALGGKGGGGRPDMAQGGGPNGGEAAKALEAIRTALQGALAA